MGPGSFLGGLSSDGTNPAAAVFQPSNLGHPNLGYSTQPFSPPPVQAPPASVSPLGAGVLGGLPSGFDSVGSLGGGLGPSLGGGGGAGGGSEYDDWGDLQLQLPSDLGEMLGADPMSPHQQHTTTGGGIHSSGGGSSAVSSGVFGGVLGPGTGLYASVDGSHGNGNGLPSQRGWGAF